MQAEQFGATLAQLSFDDCRAIVGLNPVVGLSPAPAAVNGRAFQARTDDELSLAEKVAKFPQHKRDAVFAGYTQADYASLDFDWSFWGRPEQIAPPGTWDILRPIILRVHLQDAGARG
jgi:hypothetical protein